MAIKLGEELGLNVAKNKKILEDHKKIGKKAIKEAQERSLGSGVPYFQMPDGEITSKVPKEYEGIYK